MHVLIGGASGLIGRALVERLAAGGHRVSRLVRRAVTDPNAEVRWDPGAGLLDESALRGVDAVIHLSGESIAGGRWTAAKKTAIRDSRIASTQLIAEAIQAVESPPRAWLCASAVGYYGNRGDAWLTEDSAPGDDFLAGVCVDWEGATRSAAERGVRVVNLRFGVVLSAEGGALRTMLLPFKLGVGGVVGSGAQYLSWITAQDAVGAIVHGLEDESIGGPVNVVAPNPVTNREFTKALGRALSRPTVCPLPAFAARLVLGEMADALLLGSVRARPKRLEDTGFVFAHSRIEEALRHILSE